MLGSPYFPLQPGGGGHKPQSKTVSINSNGDYLINADEGYDCLSSVTANVNVSAGGTPVPERDVNFIDYDGTLLMSYTKDEIMGMDSLPEAPDHSGDDIPLTFDGWNWTLEKIKSQLQNGGAPVRVGANYHTTDGKTHVIVEQKEDGADSWGVALTTPDYRRGITIDWGDGNTETPSSSPVYHRYSNAGVYDVMIEGDSSVGFSASNTQAVKYAKIIAVRYSSSITSIGGSLFQNCHSLQSISIPSSVTSIGSSAFEDCNCLRSATIPEGVTSIGTKAFYGCYSLQSISIPSSVTSIGNYAFYGCYSLQSATIPEGVASIGTSVFQNCHSLQSISIPSSVTSIDYGAFYDCRLLQSVTIIPEGVTSIGDSAFYNCYALYTIHLKPTVPPELGNSSTFRTSNQKKIVVPKGSLEAYKSATNWSALASVIVEED